jgi:hypothetical protein
MKPNLVKLIMLTGLIALAFLQIPSCGCDDAIFSDDSSGTTGSKADDDNSISTDGDVCGDPQTILGWPTSGYYLEFKASHEVFHVWVTSETAVAGIAAWLSANPAPGTFGIPGGPIEINGAFNPGYTYRIKPEFVTFSDTWDESCDAAACYVQDDLQEWISDPITWCPWSAVIQKVWNCAGGSGSSCGNPVYPPDA